MPFFIVLHIQNESLFALSALLLFAPVLDNAADSFARVFVALRSSTRRNGACHSKERSNGGLFP